jgi:predicted deacylase
VLVKSIGTGIWLAESGRPGRRVCISFGVHGNERSPIEAGTALVARLEAGETKLARGSLLLIHANPKATDENQRWSAGGVDLNRCFHEDVLAREPSLYEERRAREIVAALEAADTQVLVDFHCTVEPGRRFAMHHPSNQDAAHEEVTRLLETETVLADPELRFGGVSLDEWASLRGRVGICYETGWVGDPRNTGAAVLTEMLNVLVGLGLLEGRARAFEDKDRIDMFDVIRCERAGFRWSDGIGENLQALKKGTKLGAYADGTPVTLARDATLVFPKKKPELMVPGKPLVYLARKA